MFAGTLPGRKPGILKFLPMRFRRWSMSFRVRRSATSSPGDAQGALVSCAASVSALVDGRSFPLRFALKSWFGPSFPKYRPAPLRLIRQFGAREGTRTPRLAALEPKSSASPIPPLSRNPAFYPRSTYTVSRRSFAAPPCVFSTRALRPQLSPHARRPLRELSLSLRSCCLSVCAVRWKQSTVCAQRRRHRRTRERLRCGSAGRTRGLYGRA